MSQKIKADFLICASVSNKIIRTEPEWTDNSKSVETFSYWKEAYRKPSVTISWGQLGISKNRLRTCWNTSKGPNNKNKDGKIYLSLTSPSPFFIYFVESRHSSRFTVTKNTRSKSNVRVESLESCDELRYFLGVQGSTHHTCVLYNTRSQHMYGKTHENRHRNGIIYFLFCICRLFLPWSDIFLPTLMLEFYASSSFPSNITSSTFHSPFWLLPLWGFTSEGPRRFPLFQRSPCL